MTEAERMRRVEELFHCAIELPPSERAAYVGQHSGGGEAVQQEVLELLQAESAVGDVIASAAAETPRPLRQPDENAEEAWAGRTAGAYRLLRLLGRGGMGVVYLAERSDGASQPVAIKFMRRSLHVAAGALALEQFLLERDALASLQHPNIARLLDAGVAPGFGGVDEGEAVPYVVMEYVEGQRLDHACDAASNSPDGTARIIAERMLALCEAVSFAHRNLVLHRDLKPANVLVSSDGAVKLLDFGTLKMLRATDSRASEPSAMTQAGMRPLTLRYAAPEHVLGQAVTTASDVYSLGVVLYRLLAGQLPPELETINSLPGAGLLQWFERLKAGTITPPSRLNRRKFPRELAEDLDAIALKAMRYEPEARYGGADAMAGDLRRALEGQAVRARGESTRYRVSRWYARNRSLFWAGAAAAAVLLAGVIVMDHETAVARAEERTATAGVEQERQLAHTLLFDYFDQLRALPGSTDAQKRAVTQAVAYLNGLNESPNSHARNEPTRELQMDQVQGYTTMGSVLGSPYEDNLGQPDTAVTVLQNGVRLAQQLAARYPNDTDVLKAEAGVNQALGNVYVGEVRMKDALAADREAASVSERLASQPTATAPDIAIAASAHDAMGDLLNGRDGSSTSDPERSKQFYEQALAYDRRELQLDPTFFRARRGVAVEMHKLGLLLEGIDPVASAAAQQKALDWLNGFSAQDRAKPAVSRLYYAIEQHVGQMDVRIGRTREGLALMGDVLARYQAVYAADRINDQALYDVVELESNLGEAYEISGNGSGYKEQAIAHLQACIGDLALLSKHDPKNMNWSYREALVRYRLASVANASGESRKREAVALAAFAAKPDFNVSDLPDVVDALNATHADPQLAWTLAQRAVTGAPALDSSALTTCAQAAASAGKRDDARRLAARALGLLHRENIATAQQREEIAANTKLAGS